MRLLSMNGLILAMLLTFQSTLQADDAAAWNARMDECAVRAASAAINQGAPLFNRGDQAGCYRLYEGSALAIQTMLDHRTSLREMLSTQLAAARNASTMSAKAYGLRAGLDAVIKECGSKKKPLWERLGGEPAVTAVVHEFVMRAAKNPEVNFFRDGQVHMTADQVRELERQLVALVSAVSGGPLKYTGKDMKSAHAGMRITDAEFNALASDLAAVLKQFQAPQAEIDELIGIVATTRGDIVEVAEKPLWDRLGGEPAVRAVVQEFLRTAAVDKKANIDRNGNYPLTEERAQRVEQLVVEFISSVAGGPLKYTGRDMKNSHSGMKITEDEFNAAAGHLVAALKKYDVPEELINELVGLVAGTAKDIVEVPHSAKERVE